MVCQIERSISLRTVQKCMFDEAEVHLYNQIL